MPTGILGRPTLLTPIMQVSINGKQIDLGSSLRSHVQEKMGAIMSHSGSRHRESSVHFSREGADFRADLSLHMDHHVVLQAHAVSGDVYAAFEGAGERLAKRLRRYKSKIRHAHRVSTDDHDVDNRNLGNQGRKRSLKKDGDHDDKKDGPMILVDMSTAICTLSVYQAVQRMLADRIPAMLFRNASSDRINMVYCRSDGKAVWVDPDLLDDSSGHSDKNA